MPLRKHLVNLITSPAFIVIVAFLVRMGFLIHEFHVYVEPILRDNLQFGAEQDPLRHPSRPGGVSVRPCD